MDEHEIKSKYKGRCDIDKYSQNTSAKYVCGQCKYYNNNGGCEFYSGVFDKTMLACYMFERASPKSLFRKILGF